MSTEPATILEYAPAPTAASTTARLLWTVFYRGLLAILGLVIGAGLGFAMTPTHTLGVGLLKVPDSVATQQIAGIQAAQQAQVTRMQSPALLDAVLATLQAKGHALPVGQAGRAKLANSLQASAIPDSRLIQVSFKSSDAALCTDAVNAFMQDGTVVANIGPGTTLAPAGLARTKGKVGILGGAIVGTLIAILLMIRHQRRSHRASA